GGGQPERRGQRGGGEHRGKLGVAGAGRGGVGRLRDRGSRRRSPTVLRKTPDMPRTQWTARSMSAWLSSGWYHVVWVRSAVAHGPRAMDLMIWTATFRSRQRASSSSTLRR